MGCIDMYFLIKKIVHLRSYGMAHIRLYHKWHVELYALHKLQSRETVLYK